MDADLPARGEWREHGQRQQAVHVQLSSAPLPGAGCQGKVTPLAHPLPGCSPGWGPHSSGRQGPWLLRTHTDAIPHKPHSDPGEHAGTLAPGAAALGPFPRQALGLGSAPLPRGRGGRDPGSSQSSPRSRGSRSLLLPSPRCANRFPGSTRPLPHSTAREKAAAPSRRPRWSSSPAVAAAAKAIFLGGAGLGGHCVPPAGAVSGGDSPGLHSPWPRAEARWGQEPISTGAARHRLPVGT